MFLERSTLIIYIEEWHRDIFFLRSEAAARDKL
jgi:hypothetical protein